MLDFDGPHPASVVSNLDWTGDLGAIELLRDLGKHFSINTMLAKESVSTRLAEAGISYTEFSYMILQAYDFFGALPDLGMSTADRRFRPVGQHHGRPRPDPTRGGPRRPERPRP